MAVEASTLSSHQGKNVVLTYVPDGETDAVEVEGKVEAASEFGLAFKEKGRREVILVEPANIEEITNAPTKPKTLPQKKLKAVNMSNVRVHLLDRHGLTRDEANNLTDEEAWDLHDQIDHDPLGHRHKSEDDEDEDENENENENEE